MYLVPAIFLHYSLMEGEKAREITCMKERKEEAFKSTFTIATLITKTWP